MSGDPINNWMVRFDAAVKRYHEATDEPTREAAIKDMKGLGFTDGDALYYLSHRGKNAR